MEEKIGFGRGDGAKYFGDKDDKVKAAKHAKDVTHSPEAKTLPIAASADSKDDASRRRITEGCDDKLLTTAHKPTSFGASDDDDDLADQEFMAMMKQPTRGEVALSTDPHAQEIALGLRIDEMSMRDMDSGRLLWHSDVWSAEMFRKEMTATVPKEILMCSAVSREILFSSRHPISNFRLEQRVFLSGCCLEEHLFKFGFVIPGSTNTWQQIIYAAPPDKMLPVSALSGNVTFETSFYDGNLFLCKVLFRIFYE